jgi:hypothetical protein
MSKKPAAAEFIEAERQVSDANMLSSATIVISAPSLGSVHTSTRTLPAFVAAQLAIHYPQKVNIGVLTDVLRAFEEYDRLRLDPGSESFDSAFDLRFVPLADALAIKRSVYQNGAVCRFVYENFVWAATIKHTVLQDVDDSGLPRYVYFLQLILPSDAHVFKEGAVIETDTASVMSTKTKRGEEVASFIAFAADFVQRVTGLKIEIGRDKVVAQYDDVEQRASFSVLFDQTKRFEVAWEYGVHERAARLTSEEIAFMQAHQDDIFSVLEGASS